MGCEFISTRAFFPALPNLPSRLASVVGICSRNWLIVGSMICEGGAVDFVSGVFDEG